MLQHCIWPKAFVQHRDTYAEERVLLWSSVEGIKISIIGAKQHIVRIGKIGCFFIRIFKMFFKEGICTELNCIFVKPHLMLRATVCDTYFAGA